VFDVKNKPDVKAEFVTALDDTIAAARRLAKAKVDLERSARKKRRAKAGSKKVNDVKGGDPCPRD
jgi:hypothetical protein